MNKHEIEALHHARNFASEAEAILDIPGIEAELAKIKEDEPLFVDPASRGIDLVADIATIAALLITLFMWIDQIRRGNFMEKTSREDIVQELIRRVLADEKLSNAAKERLVTKALDSVSTPEP